ncbi:hypothetical protein PHISP_05607 [Aspergillus sp. HF37]|nr:hypothetical protein PHISP_05607 [Aspergillus sp. HF37]
MISCVSTNVAEVRSCNIELSPILPSEYEQSAVCKCPVPNWTTRADIITLSTYQGYEASPESGTAVCAFNGTGYALNGSTTPVPETCLCDFVKPAVAQEDQPLAASTGSVEKGLDSFAEAVAGLLARLLVPGSGSSKSTNMSFPMQETVYCSNPHLERHSALVQTTGTASAGLGTEMSAYTAPSTETPPLVALSNLLQVSTVSGTSSNEGSTSTSLSGMTTATEAGRTSSVANASLTTVTPTKPVTSVTASQTATSGGAPAMRVGISSLLSVAVSCLLFVVRVRLAGMGVMALVHSVSLSYLCSSVV